MENFHFFSGDFAISNTQNFLGGTSQKNHLLERVVNGMVVNTWCEKVHPAKGDGGDGHVAEQEEGVGDAQRGEQQVEHIVHLPESHQ